MRIEEETFTVEAMQQARVRLKDFLLSQNQYIDFGIVKTPIGLASIPTISTVNILALIRQIHTLNTYILVSTMEGKIYPHSTNGWYILESP